MELPILTPAEVDRYPYAIIMQWIVALGGIPMVLYNGVNLEDPAALGANISGWMIGFFINLWQTLDWGSFEERN